VLMTPPVLGNPPLAVTVPPVCVAVVPPEGEPPVEVVCPLPEFPHPGKRIPKLMA
jgi:hypothetical protein